MISKDSTGLLILALTLFPLFLSLLVLLLINVRMAIAAGKLGRFMLAAKTSRSHGETAIIYGNLQ